MRSKLKTKLFHNLENTKSLSGNIYVVIVNQQIRYFLNWCKPIPLQLHITVFCSAKHSYKCCRNKHFSDFPLFFSFGQTKNNSEEELFAICQHLFQSTIETRIVMVKKKDMSQKLTQLLSVKITKHQRFFFKLVECLP